MTFEPKIRYCATEDGVSIAWGDAGSGPALLYCGATPFSHVQDHFVVFEKFYALLSRSFRVITFDARGVGMSQREVAGVSAATLLIDAQAVVEAAELERFVVFSDVTLLASATALQLAVTLSERVTRVVLESPFQSMRELADTPVGRVGRALAEADWNVYVETVVRVLGGWEAADHSWIDPMAKAAAGWVSRSVGLRYLALQEDLDLGELLRRVRQPALVLKWDATYVPAQCSQRVAASIAGAQFRQYADPNGEHQVELIRAFAGQLPPPLSSGAPTATGTAVILFTDIVSSTELTERMGDVRFRDASRVLDAGLRTAIREAGGTAIDRSLGDGVLATFPSAAQAIDGARRCLAQSAASELGLHIGLHAGDVIREDNNVYGGAVNIASRICGLSAPGEILVSDVVRGMARSSAGVEFEDRGEQEMKGVGEPVRVYAVRCAE
jgi:class 3 adenylate cyclase/pimeloyl-ACP methyl ester carboxylesterase